MERSTQALIVDFLTTLLEGLFECFPQTLFADLLGKLLKQLSRDCFGTDVREI